MPQFSKASVLKLRTCHTLLQALFDTVILTYDCTVIEGRRGKIRQNNLQAAGLSKVVWPHGKHNVLTPTALALAVDVAPYIKGKGVSWNAKQCYHFGGYVLATANQIKIPVRWGGDWDQDYDVLDQEFNDLVHWELVL